MPQLNIPPRRKHPPMRFFPTTVVRAVALFMSVSTLLSPASPAIASPDDAGARPVAAASSTGQAAELPATSYYQTFTGAGMTSRYHVYTDGVDRSRPVGVVFYLGGDYVRPSETWVHNPGGTHLSAMAAEARKKNMILVVPLSPDQDTSGVGISWWQDADANGDYFRALESSLVDRYGLDTSRVWLMGYSGGAEFLTYEVLADRQDWIRGGGATLVGGGGSHGMQTAPSATVRGLPISWFVGSLDLAGSTNPPTWSAWAAAHQGQQRYIRDGFTRASLATLPGIDHQDYDMVSLLREQLAALPDAAPSAAPSPWLKGAIKSHYQATGADAVYGQPLSAERLIIGGNGAVYQPFSKDYRYYWSAQTGAVPVRMTGEIGAAFVRAGYERAWGYPVNRERALSGGAYQDFQRGGTRYRAMWSSGTGAHAIKLSGAIGTRWKAAGYERGWGYPATDEYAVPSGVAQKFSNGYTVTWNRTTGKVTVGRG